MKRITVTVSLWVTLLGTGVCSSAPRAATVEQAPDSSAYSAAALYDLGNFYAHTGHPAMAVLNYERALIFAPRDPDIQANLRRIRESVGAPSPNGTWFSRHDRWANPNVLYWVGIIGLLLAGLSLVLRRAGFAHRTVLSVAAVVGIALMGLAIGDALATTSILHEAVAMSATAARAAPIPGAEPIFTVALADILSVHEVHGSYDLVTDSQGRAGWVASSDLQPVIPGAQRARTVQKIIRSGP
jgi:hypothetical protein